MNFKILKYPSKPPRQQSEEKLKELEQKNQILLTRPISSTILSENVNLNGNEAFGEFIITNYKTKRLLFSLGLNSIPIHICQF